MDRTWIVVWRHLGQKDTNQNTFISSEARNSEEGVRDWYLLHGAREVLSVTRAMTGGDCEWCGKYKENRLGLCASCGRFPPTTQSEAGPRLSFIETGK